MTPKPSKGSVMIGYISGGDIRIEFTSALAAVVGECAKKGIQLGQQPHVSGPRIAGARNHMAETFLKSGFEWLLMIDTDMTFKPDVVEQFLKVADPVKAPMVGGLCFGKGRDGLFPTIYHWSGDGVTRAEGWDEDTMVPVDGTGAAALFVHRSVFVEIAKHFKEPWIWFEEGTLGGDRQVGEDLTFCMRARSLGFPIFVHTGIPFGHVKPFTIDTQFYYDWCRSHRLIVTGTGRCGTAFVAKVLQLVKVPADHERMFNPSWHEFPPWGRADCSWLAAPYLAQNQEAFIVHLVRDPLATINSFVGIRFFDLEGIEEERRPYLEFARHFCPEAFEPDDPIERAMRFYVLWNEGIEPFAVQRLRVEDEAHGANLRPAVWAAGNASQAWEIDEAIAKLPEGINGRPRAELTWADLPVGEWRDRLSEMAKRYGYKVPK